MATTDDQDKAIEAIMNREGYGHVEVATRNPRSGFVVVTDEGGVNTHYVREDGAEIIPGIVPSLTRTLGCPAHEEAS